jgi:hypothetical protein
MPSACGPIILQKSQLEKRPHRRIATKDKQLGNTLPGIPDEGCDLGRGQFWILEMCRVAGSRVGNQVQRREPAIHCIPVFETLFRIEPSNIFGA